MRIDLAYCLELNRVVDIYTARLEFSLQTTHEKFQFYCSDQVCRESVSQNGGVRVTAVNHQTPLEDNSILLAQDHSNLKSPHFRKWDSHSGECPWVGINGVINEIETELDENSVFLRLNKIDRKLITRFLMPDLNIDAVDESELEISAIRVSSNSESRKRKMREYIRNTGATATSLETLVSCYEELSKIGKLDEVLTIPGHGTLTYKQFFKQIKFAKSQPLSVIHGGARLKHRYGRGFALGFMDRYEKLPIKLYVSHEMITSSRFGAHLARTIDELEQNEDQRPYVKVYWIGGVQNQGAFYEATVKSLSHLVMRLAYPKATTS